MTTPNVEHVEQCVTYSYALYRNINYTTLQKYSVNSYENIYIYIYTKPLTQKFHTQVFTQENYYRFPQKYCSRMFIEALF